MKTPVTKIYEFYQAMGKISEPEKVFFESMLKEEKDNMIDFGQKLRITHFEYFSDSEAVYKYKYDPDPLFNQMFEQK